MVASDIGGQPSKPEEKMLDRYLKLVLAAIAVLFMLTIKTPPALAQSCGAKTCTQAFQACMGKHCHEEGGVGHGCYTHCQGERERCMQTGEFLGRYCQLKGLIRQ
jgi:hypothetical protein